MILQTIITFKSNTDKFEVRKENDMFKDKNVVLGVCGGIAAYKIASLASALAKQGANVFVIMTKNATNFITSTTFETLTSNKCIVDTFDRNFNFEVEHIALAKKADVVLIAPATANVIGKISNGIADDMLTTTILACTCPVIISPAMNTRMYNNKIVKDNIKRLEDYGYEIIKPASGYLACGDCGEGKMPEPKELLEYIEKSFYKKDLIGKNVLVSAGATREALDPVRFISNLSTGKMGIELARAAAYRGAEVSLVLGVSSIEPPHFPNIKIIRVNSANDMFEEIKAIYNDMDIVIKAAAVADFRPAKVSNKKIKKTDKEFSGSIELEKTEDILKFLAEHKKKELFLCGFSMETENVVENSIEKLKRKNLDMIVANNLKQEGAGFGVDTNVVTIITKENVKEFDIMTKKEVAHKILDEIISPH